MCGEGRGTGMVVMHHMWWENDNNNTPCRAVIGQAHGAQLNALFSLGHACLSMSSSPAQPSLMLWRVVMANISPQV
ncbi:hypothetical protein E2C01_030934 [Portunus trituberculatus]|uniref:Uncharacterized protein n=1 Tax=Portunus trituberculatus TaxID=210409 RepID=A0A5B7EVI5_PORTR|nr:hypothetical protein [Portunus trituberculatus]